MGTFRDIVRNSTEKEKTFKLGFTIKDNNENAIGTVEFVEKEGGIEPNVSSVTMKFNDGEIIFQTENKMESHIRLTSADEKQNQYRINCGHGLLERPAFDFFFHLLRNLLMGVAKKQIKGEKALVKYLKARENSGKSTSGPWNTWAFISVFSTAPVRSRPKRTYDPTREFDDPEGSDVPMYLMRIEATDKQNWEALKTQLVEFGRNSGLFENIDVKNFGRSLGAPFQLQVKVRGPKANITDVGYGVSQILPILVQILNSSISKNAQHDPMQSFFSLLQQPEIHLHPKAQAELSSLLVKLANKDDQSFIVETHSDYMIDRARIEIIRGKHLSRGCIV